MTRIACKWIAAAALASSSLGLMSCDKAPATAVPATVTAKAPVAASAAKPVLSYAAQHLGDYAQVTLSADLSGYSAEQKQMLAKLIAAGKIMDDLYWQQTYGDKDALLSGIRDEATHRYAEINYGPWDRLNADRPFVAGIGRKPSGANFYPPDMSKDEFGKAKLPGKEGLYSLLRRDSKGTLILIPYREAYTDQLQQAADLLNQASALAADPGFKKYLALRAQSLLTDQYRESDLAWLDMKDNTVDLIIGPIETYEDALFGYKASYECFVLLKDMGWSKRLARYAQYLPQLQKDLPVSARYKREKPGADSDLGAYNAIYYAGDANAGAKTIADNLPNDEEVQLQKGTRRLQMENVTHAKFDKIMLPIANELIATDQLKHVTFDAFFQNTMFHEVAHGLGIKSTVDHKGTVRM
ncbi:MAG: Zn-dependent hydrolase, partial [Gammaproteobacteria bacterium]